MSSFYRTCLLVFYAGFGWACSSAVPTGDPGVSAVGEHFYLYEGSELEIALGAGYAAGHVGEEFLLLGASFAGANSGRMTTVDSAGISVQTPDGRMIPLMSQAEFLEAYGRLNAAARRAEVYSPTALESRPTRRPCGDWFFRVPTDGLARDVLTFSSIEVCEGILFFHVPEGVEPGRWVLEIKLEDSVVEIPFVLD
jgi:hypothetical protein